MSTPVSYAVEDGIGVITINNPPVNALGAAVREGLIDAIDEFNADESAGAAIVICEGRTFCAGADISEFGKPKAEPWLPQVVSHIEASGKVVVAALHGTALGGGLEVAMGCHYRCAVPTTRVGQPEVNLGIPPGAGGCQRLPRLAGIGPALDMLVGGRPVAADKAHALGIIDEIIDGDLKAGALDYAARLAADGAPAQRTSAIAVDPATATPEVFAQARADAAKKMRGFYVPDVIIDLVEAGIEHSLAEFSAIEMQRFEEARTTPHSRAQRHLFFAERAINKIPDVPKDTPTSDINEVAVIGAGTMGGGIAMVFANAGIPVKLIDVDAAGLERGLGTIRKNYEAAVKKGRMSEGQLAATMQLIEGSTDFAAVAGADLVVEAVFENMAIKLDVFGKLDAHCKEGAILATNTSTLDINQIAAATERPEAVIGLHFFAPANVMTLLEVVRGEHTVHHIIATCMQLGKQLRKTAVLVGVCFGFVGNRMFLPYLREAELMMLEGVPPERIDQVAYDWGMAMGPHAVTDLSGIDVFCKINDDWEDAPDDPAYFRIATVLHGMERYGQKTGAGIYKYDGRKAVPDPEVMEIAAREAAPLGIEKRDISDEEILDRLLLPLINEGALILEEGIALRASDIDVVYVHGYGMPRYRGGPMCYADEIGLDTVLAGINRYRERYGDAYWTPAPLLEKLVAEGRSFAQFDND
ncbi:MAG: 3-hydroxyacyl-CoA dehydrogenase [Gammaproteobacteria bacterium]|nr:enoyl-CoA hydratase/isomerase family protein [Gammaproteobacteria bacterium]NNM00610.1 3-hydroxyacyl-CoA dehydrogenase [Gammaproteobacteria bacterium]